MTRAYIALGANLGDPSSTVLAAIEALRDLPHSQLIAASSLYRTAPVGLRNQPDFVNAVISIETQLDAPGLLDELFAIEARFGRSRSIPNAPRTLDLDLLLHGDTICDDPQLTLPHPRMHQRAFVLVPLAEIAPDITMPVHGMLIDLLQNCADQQVESMTAQV
ncbi:MAG: 2-amino-4-hydroxy-6-hydroxymethyldihydropteridine diphosphokinase [Georgfuchsia sp.]